MSVAYVARRVGTTTILFVPARQATLVGEIDSSESIPGLHKRLQIRAQLATQFQTRFLELTPRPTAQSWNF